MWPSASRILCAARVRRTRCQSSTPGLKSIAFGVGSGLAARIHDRSWEIVARIRLWIPVYGIIVEDA